MQLTKSWTSLKITEITGCCLAIRHVVWNPIIVDHLCLRKFGYSGTHTCIHPTCKKPNPFYCEALQREAKQSNIVLKKIGLKNWEINRTNSRRRVWILLHKQNNQDSEMAKTHSTHIVLPWEQAGVVSQKVNYSNHEWKQKQWMLYKWWSLLDHNFSAAEVHLMAVGETRVSVLEIWKLQMIYNSPRHTTDCL